MKKKIVIDCSSIKKEKNGINRYTFEIIDRLKHKKNLDIYLVTSSNLYSINKKNFKQVTEFKIKFLKILFFQIHIFFYLSKLQPNIYWSPNHRLPLCLFFFKNIKKVVTIHDLCYLKCPNKMKFLTKFLDIIFINFSILIADKLITVSNSVKLEIINKFKIPKHKILKIYSGSFFKKKILYHKNKNKKKYLLFVGTIEPRKNIKNLILGFDLFYRNSLSSNIYLYIAGSKGWDNQDYTFLIEKLESKDYVKIINNPSDDKLRKLYKNCLAHINASYYEGFGLPIVEAMSYNKISILSNISIFKEITRNKFIYFNPEDIEDISKKINFVIKNKIYQKKISFDFKRKYSWNNSVSELNNLFLSI